MWSVPHKSAVIAESFDIAAAPNRPQDTCRGLPADLRVVGALAVESVCNGVSVESLPPITVRLERPDGIERHLVLCRIRELAKAPQ